MDIKNRIRELLKEMDLEQLYGDYKSRIAKANNLKHIGYGNWKNPAGDNYTWDESQKIFVKRNSFVATHTSAKAITKSELPKDDYEIKLTGKEYGLQQMVSKNWAMSFTSYGNRHDFDLYSDLENIGKRGKTVRHVQMSLYYPQTQRIAWGSTIKHAIEERKPKTAEEVLQIISGYADTIKSTEPSAQFHKYDRVDKGIYSGIPDFGLEGDFEDVSGEDVFIKFSKPDIKITSNTDSESARTGNMISFIEIKWTYVKKVEKVKEQLKSAVGLTSIAKILSDNKIPYESRSYMDPMYQ